MDDKYRKKPVVIQAWQYNVNSEVTIGYPQWIIDAFGNGVLRTRADNTLICKTDSHGDVEAHDTDWIIRGVEGEIYPCKNSVFEATYDKA